MNMNFNLLNSAEVKTAKTIILFILVIVLPWAKGKYRSNKIYPYLLFIELLLQSILMSE